jgi:SpoVK/Ycf46/Vps4 family AAA+-type ATPase
MEDVDEYGSTRNGTLFRLFGRAPPSPPVSAASSGAAYAVDADGYSAELRALVDVLNTPTGLKMYKVAYRENMKYKVARYRELHRAAEEDVQQQIEIINLKTPELKRLARVSDDHDNWQIFESISEGFREAKDRAAAFEAIQIRASQRLEGSMGVDDVRSQDDVRHLRDDLVRALRSLANFSSQAHVVAKAVDIVGAFIKDPRLFRTKLMNFMLVGGAGTGKTTLASVIGDVFAKAGIFVGNRLIEAGRAELVGQYEGQTVARTRNFLINNLDSGVIFIDEAYAITPWQNGKPEGYGSEATTALVEFMTRYIGLYCIIVAGYEMQMTRYFLPTNEGLSRRFPNKLVLRNRSPDDLVLVFKRALLKSQGLEVPVGKTKELESTGYFDADAWQYLREMIQICTAGDSEYVEEMDPATRQTYTRVRRFAPTWDRMFTLFENQAGSMVNLADEAITVLIGTVSYEEVTKALKKNVRPTFRPQPRAIMRHIIVQLILKSAFSDFEAFLTQLEQVESLI